MARLVVPGYPHHVTQRGNRRQKTFFCPDDYRRYMDCLEAAKSVAEVEIWAYCLMPNHVHFVAVPGREDGLRNLFAEAHREYTRLINQRHGWRGHLWQERFHSCVLDGHHLYATGRYVELNPVRAGLCERPEDWPWSSARAHLAGFDDRLVSVRPFLEIAGDWRSYLDQDDVEDALEAIREHSRTGRPLGSESFVEGLEAITGRSLKRRLPGPKRPNDPFEST